MDLVENIVEPYAVAETFCTDLVRVEVVDFIAIFTLARKQEVAGTVEYVVVARNIWPVEYLARRDATFGETIKMVLADQRKKEVAAH